MTSIWKRWYRGPIKVYVLILLSQTTRLLDGQDAWPYVENKQGRGRSGSQLNTVMTDTAL